MKLEGLLQFDHIVVQCHDNPDADAIASGWGVLEYLCAHGKEARLVYGGPRPIQKSNLVLMVETLGIPIQHIQGLDREPELLVTVDCQYGEKNVQCFPARIVAVIDHHKARLETLPALREIRDSYGACATIVWDMLLEAGFDAGEDEGLSTALYYGLFMDTGKLQELRHPKDKDLRDALEFRCSRGSLFLFQNCNLSLDELRIAGQALANYDYHKEDRFAIVEAERCDPNILGVISDMLIEVDAVDTCIAFCMLDGGAKLSVRSCVKETRANELAAFVAEGLGSGGGHTRKSGGFLREDLLLKECESRYGSAAASLGGGVRRLLAERMGRYFKEQDVIHTGSEDVPNLSGEPVYQKKRLPIGYVRATDLYPAGTKVEVRMLEGDIPFTIKEDTYFTIGVETEVYKNDEAYFLTHNDPVDTRNWSAMLGRLCAAVTEQYFQLQNFGNSVTEDVGRLGRTPSLPATFSPRSAPGFSTFGFSKMPRERAGQRVRKKSRIKRWYHRISHRPAVRAGSTEGQGLWSVCGLFSEI